MHPIAVVKIGGNELDDNTFLAGLCQAIAAFSGPLVLVHGGGKEITAALQVYDQPTQFVEGLRVTPPESMRVMEMVVSGINKRVVARLGSVGVRAIGLSGVDLQLLRCQPYRPNGADLGRVGAITHVEVEAIEAMLAQGWLPTFAPVAIGEHDYLPYNVNADHVAQAVAAALGREHTCELTFVSNVPGVILGGAVVPNLNAEQIDRAIDSGEISGGMIPKVRSALAALAAGVQAVRITNLAGFAGGGTTIRMNGV
jgi:acetylglutamate kinase